jgi:hypothetical protein
VKKILELIVRTLPLVLLVAHCATETADSGSQTHWLGACAHDAECGAGLVCRCGQCTKECADGSCANLGRPAECAAPTSPAHGTECRALESTAICVPKCADGCESSEQCVAGICVPTWLGAPCSECDLQIQVARLADPASEDCGTISPDGGGSADGNACAEAALQAGRPFTLIRTPQVGTDSYLGGAYVFAAGQVYLLDYDANVCGGGPSCESDFCAPRIERRTCVDPVASDVSGVIECASMTDPLVICGPNPRCNGGGVCL